MTKPTVNVSIVAANYNNGQFLADFVDSVVNSTVLPMELIIVDDGSTDYSLQVLKSYLHLPFLKIIKFKKNEGFCNALNTGVEAATSKYILRVDPDDIMLPKRIEIQLAFMEKNPDIDGVGSNVIYFDDKTGKDLLVSDFPISNQAIYNEYLKGDHGVQHPSTMIKALVMKQYKYNQKNVLAEDYELFARMIKDGYRFANIGTPLLRMRIHAKSAGSNIKFNTIAKTFELRDEIFGTSSSRYMVKTYYHYMLNYRKFLISKNNLSKFLFLAIAIVYRPSKLIKRLMK